jgi:hypothetical protein
MKHVAEWQAVIELGERLQAASDDIAALGRAR